MTGKRGRWSPDEKARIVLASLNPAVKTAALCRDNDLSPRTLYAWKDAYMQGGAERLASPSKGRDSEKARLAKENEHLKQLVGELTLANDALKKTTVGMQR